MNPSITFQFNGLQEPIATSRVDHCRRQRLIRMEAHHHRSTAEPEPSMVKTCQNPQPEMFWIDWKGIPGPRNTSGHTHIDKEWTWMVDDGRTTCSAKSQGIKGWRARWGHFSIVFWMAKKDKNTCSVVAKDHFLVAAWAKGFLLVAVISCELFSSIHGTCLKASKLTWPASWKPWFQESSKNFGLQNWWMFPEVGYFVQGTQFKPKKIAVPYFFLCTPTYKLIWIVHGLFMDSTWCTPRFYPTNSSKFATCEFDIGRWRAASSKLTGKCSKASSRPWSSHPKAMPWFKCAGLMFFFFFKRYYYSDILMRFQWDFNGIPTGYHPTIMKRNPLNGWM